MIDLMHAIYMTCTSYEMENKSRRWTERDENNSNVYS